MFSFNSDHNIGYKMINVERLLTHIFTYPFLDESKVNTIYHYRIKFRPKAQL